jgi:glycosyltransferase involved in cell wall biosynthesis
MKRSHKLLCDLQLTLNSQSVLDFERMIQGEFHVDLGTSLVTVIVPAYNAARFLAATLESVVAQTYRHLEILVVDDGSSDETPKIVEQFTLADSRVRLLRQANGGVGAARNAGIAQARGVYIAPVDADDIWHPDKIAEQVAVMDQGSERMGFVYCWSQSVDLSGRLLFRFPPCTANGAVLRRHVFRNFLHNASVPLFRASALTAVGGYATRKEQGGWQGCEDWDLTLRVAEKYEVGVVPRYLVDYREVPSGMSCGGVGMARSFAHLIRGVRERRPGLPPHLLRWSSGFFYLYIARKCHQAGASAEAWHYLTLAGRTDPVVLLAPPFYRILLRKLIGPRRAPPKALPPETSSAEFPPERGPGFATLAAVWLWKVFARIEDKRWSLLMAEEAPE